MNITELREQYPDYADMSDMELTNSFHAKYYKDIPFKEFYKSFVGKEFPTLPMSTNIAVGAAETAATLITAPAGWMAGKIGKWVATGVAELQGVPEPLEAGKVVEEALVNAITYKPTTKEGQQAVGLVSKPIEKFVEYARKPGELAKSMGATETQADLTSDIAEIGSFALTSLIPRLRPLVKSKGEAFNLANKIGESLEYIEDPVARNTFVESIIREARETKQDPWMLLEEKQARMMPVVVEPVIETKLPAGRGVAQPKPSMAQAIPMEGELYPPPPKPPNILKEKLLSESGKTFEETLFPESKVIYQGGTKPAELRQGEQITVRGATGEEVRTFRDMLSDVNTVLGKERGSISGKDLSPEAKEALDRLKLDYKELEGKAKEVGVSLRQYLINEGLDRTLADEITSNHPEIISTPAGLGSIQEFIDKSRKEARGMANEPLRNTLTRLIVDKHGNVKRELAKKGDIGQEAVDNFELIKGSRGYAGDRFSEIDRAVWKGMKRADEEWLDALHMARRHLEIWDYRPEHKWGEFNRQQVVEYIDNLKKQLGEQKFNELWAKSEQLFDLIDQHTITRLLDEGLITEQEYNDLAQHKYLPTEYLDKLDPSYEFGPSHDKVSVMSSGLQPLGKGEKGLIETRVKKLMFEAVSRTEARIASNRANKTLYELAKDNPDNGITSISKSGIDDPVLLGTMIDGERYTFWMDRELAKEWYKNDAVINSTTANWIAWLSGAKMLKAIATGYNPAFILTNIPRDLSLIWMATDVYSAHLPVAMLEMLHDMGKVMPDVMMNKGRVKDFIKEGGSFGFLTHYGKFGGENFQLNKLKSIGDYASWLGEKSELLTRTALRERTINNLTKERANGKNTFTDEQIRRKATAVARGYIDFSEGGELIKLLDVGIPYLNASVQGTRAIFRGAKNNPARFTYQAAQIMGLSSLIYYMNHHYNKEAHRTVSDKEKEANWIITTPWTIRDDQGQDRPFYLKIAKDQGQRVFATAAEAIMERCYEGKFPTKQVWESIQDLSSMTVGVPIYQAFNGYINNYDSWFNEPIWRRENIKDSEQWDSRTMPIMKEAAKIGLSPAKLQYSINRLVPLNNPLTSLFSGAYNLASGEASKELQKKGLKQMVLENPTIKRVAGLGDSYNYEREYVQDLKVETTTNSFILTRDLDDKLDTFMREPTDINKGRLIKLIMDTSERLPNEGDRLAKRVERSIKLWQIPDRRWWTNTAELQPEARADAFLTKYNNSTQKEKDQMLETMGKVDGYTSDRFVESLGIIMRVSDKKMQDANKKNIEQLKKDLEVKPNKD